MAANFLRLVVGAIDGSDRRVSSLPMADVKAMADSPRNRLNDELGCGDRAAGRLRRPAQRPKS